MLAISLSVQRYGGFHTDIIMFVENSGYMLTNTVIPTFLKPLMIVIKLAINTLVYLLQRYFTIGSYSLKKYKIDPKPIKHS